MRPQHPSDPSPQHLSVPGGKLAYTIEGEGPCVIAIPGLPGTVRDFRWLAPALTPHVKLVRLTLPGFGGLPRDHFYGTRVPERAQAVMALIDHLNPGPIHLMGHSAGNMTLAYIAQQHSARVLSCTFLAMPGPVAHYPQRIYQFLSPLFTHPAGRAVLSPLLRHFYTSRGFPSSLTDEDRMYTLLDAAAHDFKRYTDTVSSLRLPTMVAWSRDDRLISAALSEALEILAPSGPRLHFTQGGHNIQKTQAMEIAQAMVAMIQEITSSQAASRSTT